MKKKLCLFVIWVIIGSGIEAAVNPIGSTWSGLGHLFVNYIVLLSLFPFGAGLILFYDETKKDEPIPCLILTLNARDCKQLFPLGRALRVRGGQTKAGSHRYSHGSPPPYIPCFLTAERSP